MTAFNADPVATLEEVAEALGISRQRVLQIERTALRKLRKAFLRRGITPDDLADLRHHTTDTKEVRRG